MEIGERGAGVLVERVCVKMYAASLCVNPDATLDDTREAVTTLEEIELIARRVLGGAHPLTKRIEGGLRDARAALRAREDSV